MAKWVCFLYFCPLCLFPTSNDVLPFSSVKVLSFLFPSYDSACFNALRFGKPEKKRREKDQRLKATFVRLHICFHFENQNDFLFFFPDLLQSGQKKLVEDHKDQLVWRFFTHFHTSSR